MHCHSQTAILRTESIGPGWEYGECNILPAFYIRQQQFSRQSLPSHKSDAYIQMPRMKSRNSTAIEGSVYVAVHDNRLPPDMAMRQSLPFRSAPATPSQFAGGGPGHQVLTHTPKPFGHLGVSRPAGYRSDLAVGQVNMLRPWSRSETLFLHHGQCGVEALGPVIADPTH